MEGYVSDDLFNIISQSITWSLTPEKSSVWAKLNFDWNRMIKNERNPKGSTCKSIW